MAALVLEETGSDTGLPSAGVAADRIGGGAVIGAAIGDVIPGVGNVIGGVIGAVGGFFAWLFGGNGDGDKEKHAVPARKLRHLARRDARYAADFLLYRFNRAGYTRLIEKEALPSQVLKKHLKRGTLARHARDIGKRKRTEVSKAIPHLMRYEQALLGIGFLTRTAAPIWDAIQERRRRAWRAVHHEVLTPAIKRARHHAHVRSGRFKTLPYNFAMSGSTHDEGRQMHEAYARGPTAALTVGYRVIESVAHRHAAQRMAAFRRRVQLMKKKGLGEHPRDMKRHGMTPWRDLVADFPADQRRELEASVKAGALEKGLLRALHKSVAIDKARRREALLRHVQQRFPHQPPAPPGAPHPLPQSAPPAPPHSPGRHPSAPGLWKGSWPPSGSPHSPPHHAPARHPFGQPLGRHGAPMMPWDSDGAHTGDPDPRPRPASHLSVLPMPRAQFEWLLGHVPGLRALPESQLLELAGLRSVAASVVGVDASDRSYVALPGETPSAIADKLTGDPTRAAELLAANPVRDRLTHRYALPPSWLRYMDHDTAAPFGAIGWPDVLGSSSSFNPFGQLTQYGQQFGQLEQLGQLAQMGQLGQYAQQLAQGGQLQQLGQLGQLAQVGQLGQYAQQLMQMGQGAQPGQPNPLSQLGQFAQMGQLGQYAQQLAQGGQLQQLGQLAQMGQLGQYAQQLLQMGQGAQPGQPSQPDPLGQAGQLAQYAQQLAQMGQFQQLGQLAHTGQLGELAQQLAQMGELRQLGQLAQGGQLSQAGQFWQDPGGFAAFLASQFGAVAQRRSKQPIKFSLYDDTGAPDDGDAGDGGADAGDGAADNGSNASDDGADAGAGSGDDNAADGAADNSSYAADDGGNASDDGAGAGDDNAADGAADDGGYTADDGSNNASDDGAGAGAGDDGADGAANDGSNASDDGADAGAGSGDDGAVNGADDERVPATGGLGDDDASAAGDGSGDAGPGAGDGSGADPDDSGGGGVSTSDNPEPPPADDYDPSHGDTDDGDPSRGDTDDGDPSRGDTDDGEPPAPYERNDAPAPNEGPAQPGAVAPKPGAGAQGDGIRANLTRRTYVTRAGDWPQKIAQTHFHTTSLQWWSELQRANPHKRMNGQNWARLVGGERINIPDSWPSAPGIEQPAPGQPAPGQPAPKPSNPLPQQPKLAAPLAVPPNAPPRSSTMDPGAVMRAQAELAVWTKLHPSDADPSDYGQSVPFSPDLNGTINDPRMLRATSSFQRWTNRRQATAAKLRDDGVLDSATLEALNRYMIEASGNQPLPVPVLPQGLPQMPQDLPQMPPQGQPQMPQGLPQMPQGLPQLPQGWQVPPGLPQQPQMPQGLPQLPQGWQVPPGLPQQPPMPQGLPQLPQGLQVPQGFPVPPSWPVPQGLPQAPNPPPFYPAPVPRAQAPAADTSSSDDSAVLALAALPLAAIALL